jgi:hypothetical protein
LPQLRVIARTSSFAFKGKDVDAATIGRALHVANILQGSVRKSGNMLRITAQLVRAADSSQLWSRTYDRELTDVFAVQDEIAQAVVAALKVKLLPQQLLTNPHRTADTKAHDQYLLGKAALRRGRNEGYRDAVAAFRRAIEIDPDYALLTPHSAMPLTPRRTSFATATSARRCRWMHWRRPSARLPWHRICPTAMPCAAGCVAAIYGTGPVRWQT